MLSLCMQEYEKNFIKKGANIDISRDFYQVEK